MQSLRYRLQRCRVRNVFVQLGYLWVRKRVDDTCYSALKEDGLGLTELTGVKRGFKCMLSNSYPETVQQMRQALEQPAVHKKRTGIQDTYYLCDTDREVITESVDFGANLGVTVLSHCDDLFYIDRSADNFGNGRLQGPYASHGF